MAHRGPTSTQYVACKTMITWMCVQAMRLCSSVSLLYGLLVGEKLLCDELLVLVLQSLDVHVREKRCYVKRV